MLTNLVVVYLIIVIKLTSGQEEEGIPCNLKSTGQKGVCVSIDKCLQARDDIKQKRFPQICNFQGKVIIVCCLNNDTSTSTYPSPPVTTEKSKNSRLPGVISKQKCREYSKHVFVKKAPVLIADVDRYMKNVCDFRVNLRNTSSSTARRNEFPHMALVGFVTESNNIKWICGGSLISEQYVLTAANCLFTRDYGDAQYVKVGITNRRKDTRHLQQFKIIKLIQHPRYEVSSYYNDIGLLKLEKPIEITPYAGPACLYTEHKIAADVLVATGWGTITYSGEVDDNLHKIIMNLTSTEDCKQSYIKNPVLTNGITDANMFCTVPINGLEVCQGDSGGPVQIYHSGDDVECMYDIVGIISFGGACVIRKIPEVHTRISNYIEWIEEIVWP